MQTQFFRTVSGFGFPAELGRVALMIFLGLLLAALVVSRSADLKTRIDPNLPQFPDRAEAMPTGAGSPDAQANTRNEY